MWKCLLALLAVTNLTACTSVANFYDRTDPCQTRAELNRPAGYQMPSYCGATSGRTVIYNSQGAIIGYTKRP